MNYKIKYLCIILKKNEPDTINIRVSDDYIFDAINQNAVIDKDLSYSGSFSSISSGSKCSSNIGKMSSCNTISNEVLKNKQSSKYGPK